MSEPAVLNRSSTICPTNGLPYNGPTSRFLTRSGDPDWTALAEFTKQLPEEDGVPLESPWHFAAIGLLIQVLTFRWRDRNDFYVGGNMFVYYNVEPLMYVQSRGPDFFFVNGVERHRYRGKWAVWQEGGKYPDLIIEHLSPSTATEDLTTKKAIYERTFRTPEYYCYDPETTKLMGWHLVDGVYHEATVNDRGWIWSRQLQLWLGTWTGEFQGISATWLRFYDADGHLVLLESEAAKAEVVRLQTRIAELEKTQSKSNN
jgi:Uma2 family endonuclease